MWVPDGHGGFVRKLTGKNNSYRSRRRNQQAERERQTAELLQGCPNCPCCNVEMTIQRPGDNEHSSTAKIDPDMPGQLTCAKCFIRRRTLGKTADTPSFADVLRARHLATKKKAA